MVSKINNNKKMITLILMCLGGMAMAYEKVPIREIDALTLQVGKMTTGRRSSPVPQLTCRGRNCQHAPSSVRCRNAGWDGIDVQWDCQAELDNIVKFGTIDVNCEGYEYPDDPNILAGSCGLEYTLDSKSAHSEPRYTTSTHSEGDGGIFGGIIMMIMIFGLISCMCDNSHSSSYNSYDRYNRYGSSSTDFWSGAAAGYSVGRSSGGGWGGSSGWGSSRSSGWGGGSSISSGFASTSRR